MSHSLEFTGPPLVEIEANICLPDDVIAALQRDHDAMLIELRHLESLPREDCGCDRYVLSAERTRWSCSGRCRTHGVRKGDRVAVSISARSSPSVRGDEVALAYADEKPIGTALHDAMPGQKVDVMTDDRPDWCCGEHFYVTDRPRLRP